MPTSRDNKDDKKEVNLEAKAGTQKKPVTKETTSKEIGSEANKETKTITGEANKETKEDKKVSVAQVQEKPKAKLVKVRFIENHSFNRGVTKFNCKKGDVEEVEPHLANKFVGRKLAYILG